MEDLVVLILFLIICISILYLLSYVFYLAHLLDITENDMFDYYKNKRKKK